jgi:hypothetical protein
MLSVAEVTLNGIAIALLDHGVADRRGSCRKSLLAGRRQTG